MENDDRHPEAPPEETCLARHVSLEDTTSHHGVALSGPGRLGAWYLVVFEADWRRVRALPLDGPMTLGRSSEGALLARDSSASRRHVLLTPRGDHVEVQDL